MKKLSKILSVGLSLALCAGMVAPAFAATYNIEYGDVTFDANGHSGYVAEGQKETHMWEEDNEVIVTGTTTENTITVGENVKDVTITLDNVNIDVSGTGDNMDAGDAAFSISGGSSDVTVELNGKNTLKSGYDRAGLELNDGASVTIRDEDKDGGSLTATGGNNGAGIGSGWNGTAGDITISGSAVAATSNGGAGIGSSRDGTVGNITIEGGSEVTATGHNAAASIGSGWKGTAGDINISGSTVTATGHDRGAGIGSGWKGAAGNINIEGGSKVEATGGTSSAGIGSSLDGTVGDINISGSTVTAIGKYGAGIGTGDEGTAGDINISGSTVTAIGIYNHPGAGIGGGNDGMTGDITIDDDVILLALAAGSNQWAVDPNSKTSTVVGNILIGKLDKKAISSGTVFTVLDKDGNVVREFDVYVDGKTYTSFAIDLPESMTDYIIVQMDEAVNIVNYLVYEDNLAIYRNDEDGKPMQQDGLVLKGIGTQYGFKSEDGKELPDEVKDLLDSYADGSVKPGDKVDYKDLGGNWVFVSEEQTQEGGIVDGKLQDDVFTGTWKWDGYNYTVTVDPDNGDELENKPGKVGETIPEKPKAPTKDGYEFTGWEVVDENGDPIVDEDGNPVDPFDPNFIPGKDGQKIIMKATWTKTPGSTTPGTVTPGNNVTTPTTGGGNTPGGNTPTDPSNQDTSDDPSSTPEPDPEDPVDIEDPETPLGEEPDEDVEIEDPELPLGELPEEIIDDPEVPLGDVPQTGEASTVVWLVVLLVSGMGLVYLNTGKRKENV